MKRQIKVWTGRTFMVAAVIFAAHYWGMPLYRQYFTAKKAEVFVPTTTVKSGEFIVSFHEIGDLDAAKSVMVITRTGGKVIKLIKEGTIVKKGDELAILDTSDIVREIRNQQLAVKNADADVERAKEELRMLELSNATELAKQKADYEYNLNELTLAQAELEKKKKLAEKKLIPKDQVDQAEGQVRSKQLTVDKGDADLKLKEKDCASKVEQKKADVGKVVYAANIAKSNLEEAQEELQSGVITAPADGMVVLVRQWMGDSVRALQEGDGVRPRMGIFKLPDLSTMQVKANVGEADAPKVKVGLPVLIRMEAVPNRIFHGTIIEISSLATEGGNIWDNPNATPGRKNFEVTVSVKEVDPKVLKPGMTADVEFICEKLKNALSIPLETVIEKDGKTFVFVKDGKRWKKTPIVTGKYNSNFIVVEKGLKKGQVIALRDPTRTMDEQESGTSAPGRDESKKQSAPIPEAKK